MQESERRTKEQKNKSGTRGHFQAPHSSQDEPWGTLQSPMVSKARRWPCTKFVKLCNLLNRRPLRTLSMIHSKLSHMSQVMNCKPASSSNGTEMSALVPQAKSRSLLASFQQRGTVSTASWKHPRGATVRRRSVLGFVKPRECSDVLERRMSDSEKAN